MILLLLGLLDETPPSPDAPRGVVNTWKGPTGRYEYVIPKSYDAKKGATLTLMLHGSNLTREWAFANFEVGKFRKDDILVAPDGTTSNGSGGFKFLGKAEDAKKAADSIHEWKKTFTVNRVLLYGHSQGAFFSYYFAGEHPDLVDGICAHAGGVWTWCKFPDAAKKIAIGILHGTDDPVVPFSHSEGAEKVYQDRGYANVFLKKIEGWNHWPHPAATEEVLAWCDKATARSPEDCVKLAQAALERRDYGTAWDLAERAAQAAEHRKAAKEIQEKIEGIAAKHVEAIHEAMGDAKAYGPWVAHYRSAWDAFPKTRALAEFRKKAPKKHATAGKSRYQSFKAAEAKMQFAAAFKSGRQLLEEAYLIDGHAEVAAALERWRKEYGDKLPKDELDAYEKLKAERKAADEAGAKAWQTAEKE